MRARRSSYSLKGYKIIQLLYNGATTQTYKVVSDAGLQFVAKFLQKKDEHALTEIEIVKKMHHKYILEFNNMLETDTEFVMLCPFYQSLALHYVQSIDGFTPQRLATLFYKILVGLKYIHNMKIIHGDIRPENIIVSTENNEETPHIIDFGISHYEGQPFDNTLTTPAYKPPEQDLTFKSDIYSLGLAFYVCFSQIQTASQIRMHQLFSEKAWASSNPLLIDLIKNMIERDVEKRFSLEDCLNHPYFTEQIDETTRSTIMC
ncbi:CAMK family protein kinase [Trichomonas vaginalis G3]|uniref:CAMK family protein kinase n=1 Tax=Trichomonas vaginalis (strain ATCC PRA-98 / G3) TaxID=412133 RepID=A2FLG5_TRIV3|nr:protein serine/threonine kinase protein [Trichomonas vaginalis G3]EAX94248.1 CAMK family protein kinase [Trichomonas vaginalis G3]KAI5484182.1 protein serine/threonine kinase protein [Trichomonas vaginalis G3]|eukprot:XP_001307178.1 CAMK family protein kinase [Trichomonas vaginalis G3]